MLPTDLTVAAVVEREGRFLVVEETASGRLVVTQPGGHIESGESPEEAVAREVQEEAACDIAVADLIGVYLWIHPQTRQQFLRIVYAAELVEARRGPPPDGAIHAVHWLTRADLEQMENRFRSPVVMHCIDDYLSGRRQPGKLFNDLKYVDSVLANARLV